MTKQNGKKDGGDQFCEYLKEIEQSKEEVKEDWIGMKMKEFEKMTPEEVGNGKLYGEKGVEEWLELNSEKHLYEDIVYAEPMLTLDIEKVKQFLKSSLTQQKEAIEKEWMEKIENMKCDYPKSSSQKEHQINIEIIERTVNQIREELLKQTK